MDFSTYTIDQVETRLKEINDLLNSDQEINAEELGAEIDALKARKDAIKEQAEARKRLSGRVADGMAGTIITEGGEEMNEAEKRAEEFVKTGKLEMRQLLSTGKIAKPTKVDGINGLADVASDIVDDVRAIALNGTGAWVAAYKKTDAVAAAVTDGSEIGGTASTYDYVTINPSEWGILDEISKQVAKMSPLDYQNAIEDSAVIALREYASAEIVKAIKASALKEEKTIALDQDFLRNVVLGFRPIAGKGGTVLYLAQEDLLKLGKIRGTNEKRALYEFTFDAGSVTSGTIREGGLAVKFRVLDKLEAGTQLFGQPQAVDMPMWGNYSVETDEGGIYFKKNMIGIRGLQTAGVDLAAKNGMQVITQASGN